MVRARSRVTAKAKGKAKGALCQQLQAANLSSTGPQQSTMKASIWANLLAWKLREKVHAAKLIVHWC